MKRLRALRKARQLSLRDLERESGVHYSTISRIENGEYLPNLATLLKLSRALKVSLEDLIDEEELIGLVK
jgi:transcriptional regulator with XRE-family HTH domain